MKMVPALMLPGARILILGTTAVAILIAIRRSQGLESVYIRATIAGLMLATYGVLFASLSDIGTALSQNIEKAGDPKAIEKVILQAQDKKSRHQGESPSNDHWKEVKTGGFSISSDLLSMGVWGIIQDVAQFFFLISETLLKSAREILWQLLLVLFPLGCAFYPLIPKVLHNLIVHAIALTLWLPVLSLIRVASGFVAAHIYAREFTSGGWSPALSTVPLEMMAVIMTFSVPLISQKLVSGALEGDLGTNISASVTKKVVNTIT